MVNGVIKNELYLTCNAYMNNIHIFGSSFHLSDVEPWVTSKKYYCSIYVAVSWSPKCFRTWFAVALLPCPMCKNRWPQIRFFVTVTGTEWIENFPRSYKSLWFCFNSRGISTANTMAATNTHSTPISTFTRHFCRNRKNESEFLYFIFLKKKIMIF